MVNSSRLPYADGIEVKGSITPEFAAIVSDEALQFLAKLARAFEARRQELLRRRGLRQAEIDAGSLPDFLGKTEHIRAGTWTIAPLPADLQDRRVEITGPVERKMVINALNSGASVFMADFEDAHSPTWDATIQGQLNVRDAIRGTITYTNPDGKVYQLNQKIAVLMIRPRGWHLDERHVSIDGKPISGALFDFGLYFFHNAKQLVENGSGPYFYLPKLESHMEARLWNEVFVLAQQEMGIARGTIKATVLIETILATFEMDEILYELREHSAGLNCGRWDYIFSTIKKFRKKPAYLFPDRAQVTMTTHFMRSYSLLTIKTCHRRNAPAIGGMAAQIPIKNDPVANAEALARVRIDKRREATDGHDGTWVAHPGLVPIALEEFNTVMLGSNQIERKREDIQVTTADLLTVPAGSITEAGLRNNISVSLQYLDSWLRGSGCVPINNLMEDAATVEISRAQIWQWVRHPRGIFDDGRKVTLALFQQSMQEELAKLELTLGQEIYRKRRFVEAGQILYELVSNEQFYEFLTLAAYQYIV